MSCVVYGDCVGEWVACELKGRYDAGISKALGIARDGHIDAGIIFEDWNGRSVTVHIAARGRFTREFLWCVADYAYRQLGVTKLIAPVYSDNSRMIRMILRMGFVPEALIEDAAPDGDILIFTMTKAQCRFLGSRYSGERRTYRKESTSPACA